MLRIFALIIFIATLTGCQATTPLVLAGAVGHETARHDEDIKVRFAAALQDEPDLLTFSAQAISRGKAEDAVQTYMKGYSDKSYNENMKSLAIYQIALVYMNRFNSDRNDQRALQYLERHLIEFPDSRLRPKIQQHIDMVHQRQAQAVTESAEQLLRQLNRAELLKLDPTPFDAELTGMSERAITQGRSVDAEAVYLVLYSNEATSAEMRAKALYQIGLIYMSPYNQEGDNQKALAYFRKITEEFPKTSVANSAANRVSQLINTQS